ncbi:hypothetical protein BGLA2_1960017 [Burkholderia gladioli]|nr:hypothetical protein BGLA2_1960017 [Burkholderia gladioli]
MDSAWSISACVNAQSSRTQPSLHPHYLKTWGLAYPLRLRHLMRQWRRKLSRHAGMQAERDRTDIGRHEERRLDPRRRSSSIT